MYDVLLEWTLLNDVYLKRGPMTTSTFLLFLVTCSVFSVIFTLWLLGTLGWIKRGRE